MGSSKENAAYFGSGEGSLASILYRVPQLGPKSSLGGVRVIRNPTARIGRTNRGLMLVRFDITIRFASLGFVAMCRSFPIVNLIDSVPRFRSELEFGSSYLIAG